MEGKDEPEETEKQFLNGSGLVYCGNLQLQSDNLKKTALCIIKKAPEVDMNSRNRHT